MGPYDNNIVLLDSDSDSELQHVSKKQKAGPSSQATLVARLLAESEKNSSSEDDASPAPIKNGVSPSSPSMISEYEPGLSDSLSYNASAASSDLEEFLSTELAHASDNESALPGPSQPEKRTIFESRRLLKTRGPMEFLQEYLPPTASSEDILDLITKLGFTPRNLPPLLDGENLLQLIKLLHLAMKRVRQLRSRIDNFYTEQHVLELLEKSKNILVLTGAGISTSLGIPDFRSSQGIYSRLSNLGLSDPQEVFDFDIFRTDPSIFYSIAHLILPPHNVYAPLHKFIKLLQDKGKLLRNYTQNIDNLEANAGIDPEKMIQCHGSFAGATCVTCHNKVKGSTLYPLIRLKEIPYCPMCTKKRLKLLEEDAYVEESYGVMKPDITFFGEALPKSFHYNLLKDLQQCDLVISIGTSLKVAPVADIVDKVPPDVPQILINKDPIHHCNFDVSMLGYCDDVVSYLCNNMGPLWAIDHPSYESLLGEARDNLDLEETKEKGVYNVHNRERERQIPNVPKPDIPEPDLIVLEPTLN